MDEKIIRYTDTLLRLARTAAEEGVEPADWMVVLARHIAELINGLTEDPERQERVRQTLDSLVGASLGVLKIQRVSNEK